MLGVTLAVTCVKDYGMVELWDDRAVQVVMNTGRRVSDGAVNCTGEGDGGNDGMAAR